MHTDASSGSLIAVLKWWMREGGSRYPRGEGGVAPNGRGTVSERGGQYVAIGACRIIVFMHRTWDFFFKKPKCFEQRCLYKEGAARQQLLF